jgi:putative flippase GtrA
MLNKLKSSYVFRALESSKGLRFLFAGFFNTLVGFFFYALFIFFDFNLWSSLLFGALFGTFFNFLTIGSYVFRMLSFKILPTFLFFYSIIYFINLYLLKNLSLLISNDYLAQLLLAPIIAIASYYIFSNFVFKK